MHHTLLLFSLTPTECEMPKSHTFHRWRKVHEIASHPSSFKPGTRVLVYYLNKLNGLSNPSVYFWPNNRGQDGLIWFFRLECSRFIWGKPTNVFDGILRTGNVLRKKFESTNNYNHSLLGSIDRLQCYAVCRLI